MDNGILKTDIVEILKENGKYVGTTVGVSMLPMIKSGKDVVVIVPKTEKLKKYDVALYIRKDGAYVLHRVLQPVEKGYVIRGDNCYSDEHVSEDTVIGVLEGYFKGEKYIDCNTDEKYRKYAEKRVKNYKLRRFFVVPRRKILSFAHRVYRKIFKKK